MAEYELICFGESGNSYKPALMLQATDVDWAPEFLDFMNGASRTAEYREINQMGEAPVLRHGDVTMTQTGVMLDYLAKQTGQYGPDTEAEYREIWRWILFDNHKFTANTAAFRFMVHFMKKDDGATEFLKGRMVGAWKVVEEHLKNNDFIATGRMTIADFSLVGYMYYDGEIPGMDWADWPAIDAWRTRMKSVPGWKAPYDLMPRSAA